MEQEFDPKKSRHFTADPQYFGGFLNMARHNIFTIVNHIAKLCSPYHPNPVNLLKNDELIKSSFICNKGQKLKWNLIYERTLAFLPIIKLFDEERLPLDVEKNVQGKDFAKMSDTLKILFDELQDFRNDYTHYYSIENNGDRKKSISQELSNFLKHAYLTGIEYTKKRFDSVFKENDYVLASQKVDEIVNGNNEIQQFGFVFLIAIFLDRASAIQLMGRAKGLKGTQYDSFVVAREAIMAYCVKLPHEKLQSDDPKQSLALDMINEINRCPKELYKVLSPEYQNIFKPQLDNESFNNILDVSVPDYVENYESYIEDITKKVRRKSRFPYFALRYLDEHKNFSTIRFHIDYGKLILDEYEKQLDGNNEERRIVKNLKDYEHLQDTFNEEKTKEKINKSDEEIIFEQYKPHYHADYNKIGISIKPKTAVLKLKNGKQRLALQKPEAFLSLNELHKVILLEHLSKCKAEAIILNFIQLNNSKLLDINFIREIKEVLKGKVDGIFWKRSQGKKELTAYNDENIEKLHQRKSILNEVLAAHQLDTSQIPERILNYWLNIADVNNERALSDKIKAMITDCKDRVKAIEKYKAEGKGKIPKIGTMATILAKDIVAMICSEEKKSKITSFYYDKMQECLALYNLPEKRNTFIAIVNTLGLREKGGHPFLCNVPYTNCKGIREFYELYFKEKGYKMVKRRNRFDKMVEYDDSYLRRTFYLLEYNENAGKKLTVVKLPQNQDNVPYVLKALNKRLEKSADTLESIQQWIQTSKKAAPINLPTNIFDQAITEALQYQLSQKAVSFSLQEGLYKLLEKWWTAVRQDDIQDFYKGERTYTIYDQELRFWMQPRGKFADYYQTALNKAFNVKNEERKAEKRNNRRLPDINKKDMEKVFRKVLMGQEMEIRKTAEEDRIMLLMISGLLQAEHPLLLSKAKDLLNETVIIKQTHTFEQNFDEQGTFIEDQQLRKKCTKTIEASRKGKNHSILKRYIYDRRMPELMDYYDTNRIAMEHLAAQLHHYDVQKQTVLDNVFAIETILTKNHLQEVMDKIPADKQTDHIQHDPYLLYLIGKGIINNGTYRFMKMVRNTFAHNQYPHKTTMELFINEWQENWAEQISKKYEEITNEVLLKIEKEI